MTRLVADQRASAVAAAAAHDLNNELTIVMSAATKATGMLEPGHPARLLLLELWSAAQRCAFMTSALLNYSARNGTRPSPSPMESLIDG